MTEATEHWLSAKQVGNSANTGQRIYQREILISEGH